MNGKPEKFTSTWNAYPSPQFNAQQFYRKKFAPPLAVRRIEVTETRIF